MFQTFLLIVFILANDRNFETKENGNDYTNHNCRRKTTFKFAAPWFRLRYTELDYEDFGLVHQLHRFLKALTFFIPLKKENK